MSRDDTRSQYCRISYWKKHKDGGMSACSENDDWDKCTVTPTGMYTYGEHEYTPDDDYDMRKLLAFLDKAYEAGRGAAKAEIRRVLGV